MSAVHVPANEVRDRTARPSTSVRFAATRLVPAAVLVWALIAGLGLLLTHVFKSVTGFAPVQLRKLVS